jgi:hypothetical protein
MRSRGSSGHSLDRLRSTQRGEPMRAPGVRSGAVPGSSPAVRLRRSTVRPAECGSAGPDGLAPLDHPLVRQTSRPRVVEGPSRPLPMGVRSAGVGGAVKAANVGDNLDSRSPPGHHCAGLGACRASIHSGRGAHDLRCGLGPVVGVYESSKGHHLDDDRLLSLCDV